MPRTVQRDTSDPRPEQIEARGYIISEDADLALRDVATALDAIALVFDEADHKIPELNGSQYASIFRTFARQTQQIYNEAAFANRALVRPRDFH